jgi:hypothetical protein
MILNAGSATGFVRRLLLRVTHYKLSALDTPIEDGTVYAYDQNGILTEIWKSETHETNGRWFSVQTIQRALPETGPKDAMSEMFITFTFSTEKHDGSVICRTELCYTRPCFDSCTNDMIVCIHYVTVDIVVCIVTIMCPVLYQPKKPGREWDIEKRQSDRAKARAILQEYMSQMDDRGWNTHFGVFARLDRSLAVYRSWGTITNPKHRTSSSDTFPCYPNHRSREHWSGESETFNRNLCGRSRPNTQPVSLFCM